VGTRRDDITSEQRKQIVLEVLSPQRGWGTVTKLATQYGVSRETIYTLAACGERVLLAGLEPQPHGPQAPEKMVAVNRNRVGGSMRSWRASSVRRRR
jgi:transposase-like protein